MSFASTRDIPVKAPRTWVRAAHRVEQIIPRIEQIAGALILIEIGDDTLLGPRSHYFALANVPSGSDNSHFQDLDLEKIGDRNMSGFADSDDLF